MGFIADKIGKDVAEQVSKEVMIKVKENTDLNNQKIDDILESWDLKIRKLVKEYVREDMEEFENTKEYSQ